MTHWKAIPGCKMTGDPTESDQSGRTSQEGGLTFDLLAIGFFKSGTHTTLFGLRSFAVALWQIVKYMHNNVMCLCAHKKYQSSQVLDVNTDAGVNSQNKVCLLQKVWCADRYHLATDRGDHNMNRFIFYSLSVFTSSTFRNWTENCESVKYLQKD